jgi:hypothetical protein
MHNGKKLGRDPLIREGEARAEPDLPGGLRLGRNLALPF